MGRATAVMGGATAVMGGATGALGGATALGGEAPMRPQQLNLLAVEVVAREEEKQRTLTLLGVDGGRSTAGLRSSSKESQTLPPPSNPAPALSPGHPCGLALAMQPLQAAALWWCLWPSFQAPGPDFSAVRA